MAGRILQCQAGHHLCEECVLRLTSEGRPCPSCQRPFPDIPFRCLAMEQLAEQFCFPCRWGCGHIARPSEMQRHNCELRPVRCIIKGCSHQCAAKDMPEHLMEHTHHVA